MNVRIYKVSSRECLEAEKGNLILDLEKTALIIIDMQNDFVKDGGSLVVPAANDSVHAFRQLMDQAHSAGARIQT